MAGQLQTSSERGEMRLSAVNGWREVLAIIFEGFPVELSVSPSWLVNPDTRRRLKLDYIYPDIGVAVRFIGLTGSASRRRRSDQEVAQELERERSRAEVCRANGIILVSIDPDEEPRATLREIEMALARAAGLLARGPLPHTRKQELMPKLSEARRLAGSFTSKLVNSERLTLYAEKWWERQDSLAAEGPAPRPPTTNRPFRVGMAVTHERFGPGRITSLKPHDGDIQLTVALDDGSVRIFLASLVGDVLVPD